jgi:hypothetical protein
VTAGDAADPTLRDPWKGHIAYTATVECADCTASESYPATYRPARFFLRAGWRKLGGVWRCPNCSKEGSDR